MYLVSQELYGSTKYTGTLCQLNNILDPFSIKEGDVLFYTSLSESEGLLEVPEVIRQSGIDELRSQVKSELINSLKKKKNDFGRRNYLNNRDNRDVLPPSIIPDSAPQSVIENDKIRIAPNLFEQPVSEPVPLDTPSVGGIQAEEPDEVERILVRRFIKNLNS
jgi:hypothetical protein